MNIKTAEQELLAICFHDTKFFELINPTWITFVPKDDITKLIDFVKTNRVTQIGRIHFDELKLSQELLIPLAMSSHKFSSLSPSEIKREYLVIAEALSHNHNKRILGAKLNSALETLKAGDYFKAIETIKTIDHTPKEKPEISTVSMLDALKDKPGIQTGLNFIDNTGGWRQGNIVQITGDNGSMKTTISLWICLKILMKNPKFTCFYFEKEMPKRDIAFKLISYLTQTPTDNISEETETTLNKLLKQKTPITDAISRLSIIPNTAFDNATDMANLIEYHKPSIWCLDYLTMLFDDSVGDTFSFVNKQLQILKTVTSNTNSIGIILSQIKQNVLSTKQVKIPDKADSEWSSKLNQYSAYIYTTFYPQLYHQLDNNYFFLVQLKNRFAKRNNGYFTATPENSSFFEAKQDILQSMTNWLHGYYKGQYR